MKKILHIILILGSAVLQGQKYQDVGQFTPSYPTDGLIEASNGDRYIIGDPGNVVKNYNGVQLGVQLPENQRHFLVVKLDSDNELLNYAQIINRGKSALLGGGSSNCLAITENDEIFFPISQYTDSLLYRGELLSYAPDSSSNLGGVIGMDSDLNIIFKKFFPQDVFVQSVETWNDRVYVLGYFGGDSVMIDSTIVHSLKPKTNQVQFSSFLAVFNKNTGEVEFTKCFGGDYYNSADRVIDVSTDGRLAIYNRSSHSTQTWGNDTLYNYYAGLNGSPGIFVIDSNYVLQYTYTMGSYTFNASVYGVQFDGDNLIITGLVLFKLNLDDDGIEYFQDSLNKVGYVISVDSEGKTNWYNYLLNGGNSSGGSSIRQFAKIRQEEYISLIRSGTALIYDKERNLVCNQDAYWLWNYNHKTESQSFNQLGRIEPELMIPVGNNKLLMTAGVDEGKTGEYIQELNRTLTNPYNKFLIILDLDSLSYIDNPNKINTIKIYPNPVPTYGVLHIPEVEDQEVRLLDMNGAMIGTLRLNNERINMVDYDINTGMYILEFRIEGRIIGQRIWIE